METTDELRGYNLRIIQKRNGYRFSLDPLILADFASVGEGCRILDLGTGCGVIPLLLARRAGCASIVGVEHQEEMAELALRNARFNGLDDTISVIREDVVLLKDLLPASSFDLVVANPPYRNRMAGRISPKAGRDLARHESTATLVDFLSVAKRHVRTGGSICFIYHASRLTELMAAAAAMKLAPLRLRMVHGNSRAEAGMFLVDLAKGRKGELKILSPLLVYDDDGNYGKEMSGILKIGDQGSGNRGRENLEPNTSNLEL